MSRDEQDAHRARIAFDVEVILDGYWKDRPPENVKAGILADWADTLEDWTQEQILYALRKWRNENPSRKPNPSHILGILKMMRGKAEVKRNPPAPAPQIERQRATKTEAAAIMENAGFAPKRFATKPINSNSEE
jgi:hypothetical protein